MSWTATAIIGGAVVTSVVQDKASKRAERAQTKAARSGIEEQRLAREQFVERSEPFREIGLTAGDQLQQLLADPTSQLEEINPVVDILRKQGFEDIQESAAGRGRLGSGGTLRDLTQFNTELATTVAPALQQQKFNQLFNLLGMGANVTAGQGTAGLQTAANIGNLQQQIGAAQGQQAIDRANIISGVAQQVPAAVGAFMQPGTVSPGASAGANQAIAQAQQTAASAQTPVDMNLFTKAYK